jgi:hypothetical protein
MSNAGEPAPTSAPPALPVERESRWRLFGAWLRGTLRAFVAYVFCVAFFDAMVTGGASGHGRPTALAAFVINLAIAAIVAAAVNRKVMGFRMLNAATAVAYVSISIAGTVYAWFNLTAPDTANPFAFAMVPPVLLLILRLKHGA